MNDSAATPKAIEEERLRSHSHILQPMVLEGIELNSLNRYLAAILVIIACFLVLLWSRMELSETRVALGHAQTRYDNALKEKQRLELEMNLLLSPAAIEQQVNEMGLDPSVTVVEVEAQPK